MADQELTEHEQQLEVVPVVLPPPPAIAPAVLAPPAAQEAVSTPKAEGVVEVVFTGPESEVGVIDFGRFVRGAVVKLPAHRAAMLGPGFTVDGKPWPGDLDLKAFSTQRKSDSPGLQAAIAGEKPSAW